MFRCLARAWSRTTYSVAESIALRRGLSTTTASTLNDAARAIAPEAYSTRLSPYFLFVPSSVCAVLAYWQYERKQWKEDLLELRQRMLQGPARNIWSLDALQAFERVSVNGTYLHQCSQYVGPRPKSIAGSPQPGYILITPLVSFDRRGVVLVNRGWVPAAWLEKPELTAKDAPGSVEVVGVVQPDENPSSFMFKNRPEEGEFHSIKRAELASACGLPPDTPLVQIVSTDPTRSPPVPSAGHGMGMGARSSLGPLPPGSTSSSSEIHFPIEKHQDELLRFSVMPKDHLEYAVTWAVLAVGLAAFARHVITARPTHNRFVNNHAAWKSRQGGAEQ